MEVQARRADPEPHRRDLESQRVRCEGTIANLEARDARPEAHRANLEGWGGDLESSAAIPRSAPITPNRTMRTGRRAPETRCSRTRSPKSTRTTRSGEAGTSGQYPRTRSGSAETGRGEEQAGGTARWVEAQRCELPSQIWEGECNLSVRVLRERLLSTFSFSG